MKKLQLLAENDKLREKNQKLLIENELLRSKCAKIEQETVDRMLNEETIRLDAEIKRINGSCSLTGDNKCEYLYEN